MQTQPFMIFTNLAEPEQPPSRIFSVNPLSTPRGVS